MPSDTPGITSSSALPTGTSYDVELLGVSKAFGAAPAVRELTLSIASGTFFSLLGPSGCGKTTTLRLIAGFEQPSSGRILIRSADVAGLPPYRRDVNTVFQHYALFPHLSVAENIAYGLRQRRVGKSEIQRRVAEALRMVRLAGAEARRPAELSGGQQQRVALARALVNRPAVLLLDEPLSALDLKLRKEMQHELKALQQAVGITFIYVTHDQDEAITLSDRMAVMHAGQLEQEGAPAEIYERPRTRFVADFIGLTNFIEGTVGVIHADRSAERTVAVHTALGPITCAGWQPDVATGEHITVTLRPEKIRLLPADAVPGTGWNAFAGMVTQAAFLGPQNEYHVRIGERSVSAGTELTVRQQNVSTLNAGVALPGQPAADEGTWRLFGPGEPVVLAWRFAASLILRSPEPGAGQQSYQQREEVDVGPTPASHVSTTA